MFITIEGIDGSGKSTQAERLTRWLEDYTGRKTIHTFEPGGWPDGKIFREFILSSRNFCAMSELLLFLTDRAEHVDKVIMPELRAGHNVICERWNDSTLAYQSGGHALEISQVKKLIEACNFPVPDVKIFLDISPELALTRINSRKHDNVNAEALRPVYGKNKHVARLEPGCDEHYDKFEAEGLRLMRSVTSFYRSHSDEFMKIDCDNLDIEQTFSAIITKLEANPCVQSR